jgi:hypothetical protein
LCGKFAKLKIIANTEVVEVEVGCTLLQEILKGQLEFAKLKIIVLE